MKNNSSNRDEMKLNLPNYLLVPGKPKPTCIMDFVRQARDLTFGAFRKLKISELPIELVSDLKDGQHQVVMEFIGLVVVISFHIYKVPQDQILYEVCCDGAYQNMRQASFDESLPSLSLDDIVIKQIERGVEAVPKVTITKPKTVKPWLN